MSGSKRSSCDNQYIAEFESDRSSGGKPRNASGRTETSSLDQTAESSPKLPKKSDDDLNASALDLNNSIDANDDSSVFNEGTGRHASSSISSESGDRASRLSDSKVSTHSTPGDRASRLSDSKLSLHSTPTSKGGSGPINSLANSTPVAREDCGDRLSDSICGIDAVSSFSASALSHDSSLFPDNLSRSSESGKSGDFSTPKIPENVLRSEIRDKGEKSLKGAEKKEKKKSSWYNMLNPTYKSKSDDFKRLFKELPDSERLIVDYSCALQRDILVHGRLYVSQNYICFYANIFRWETFLLIQCRDVTSMTKEKTARVIPNAIQITTQAEKHFFTSFGARDKTFLMLFRIWQNALLEQPMSSQELWQWVHYSYGEELGLTSDDDDYVAPLNMEDDKASKALELSLLKDSKRLSKESTMIIADSVSDILLEGDNLSAVSYSGLNESCEQLLLEDINEEPVHRENNEIALNPKVSENPTDMSDTTESDEDIEDVEIKCPCEGHEGKELMNAVFPLSVDQVFSLIFTGSKFFLDLLASRKTYDIMDNPWQVSQELGLKVRQITYTVTLNHSMAKSTHTTETQRLLKHSKPGQVYTVDCDVVNTGIPYCDTFMVKSVYCLTRVSKRECRLRVFGCVHYKKKPMWGLVTSLIEKSAMQGLADFATDLEAALTKEAECSSQQGSTKKLRRRKRMKIETAKSETAKDTPRILQRQPTLRKIGQSISKFELGRMGSNSDLVIIIILATLLILLFLNMLLFYKLWSLEDQNNKQQQQPPAWELPYDSISSIEREDILHILKRQDALHRAETEKWRDALGEIIKLIHLVESSLSELRSSIDIYSSNSVLKTVTLKNGQSLEDAFPSSGESVSSEKIPSDTVKFPS